MGSIEALLPLLESTKVCTESMCGEHFGVGIGVAAVRMMIGGGMLPLPSRCPFGVTASEYIFISGEKTHGDCKARATETILQNRHYSLGLLGTLPNGDYILWAILRLAHHFERHKANVTNFQEAFSPAFFCSVFLGIRRLELHLLGSGKEFPRKGR